VLAKHDQSYTASVSYSALISEIDFLLLFYNGLTRHWKTSKERLKGYIEKKLSCWKADV